MSNALSILNEDFRVLGGPQLLHNLIKWQRDAFALDFLGVDGERHQYTYQGLRKCVVSTWQEIVESLKPCPHNQHQIVPVLLPQCPGFYISILAVLESGMAFCPINLDAPSDRIKFVLQDISAPLVITTKHYEKFVTWSGGPQVFLIDESPSVPLEDVSSDLRPYREPSPQDLAYVMYTSGSTGAPKGVAVSHLAVSQSLLAHEEYIPQFKRFLQFAAPSFDVSIFEIFFPLIRGSTLVGCNRTQMLNALPDVINKLEVDAAELTPTVASSLLQQRSNVPGLKTLLTIGEMLTKPVIDSFGQSERQDGILYAMYGPTEAAIHCTINPKMRASDKVANIGVPFANVSAFIAATRESSHDDMEVRLLPLGEIGELVLGGTQLADEYLNREEQNKAAFVAIRGQRAYRTGDKARMTNTGTIEILGRISSGQVKLRGQRVELGEIEEAIYKHPGVISVVASVIDGMLVAFILSSLQEITTEGILKACASWLPTFMIPSEVVILGNFPYLASGKVDKRELEARFKNQRNNERRVIETWRTPTERIIGEAIRNVLDLEVDYVGRLAALGVDSLIAIRLAALLRSAGLNLSPVDILKADNIRSLAHTYDQFITLPKPLALQTSQGPRLQSTVQVEREALPPHLNVDEIEYAIACTPLQDAMLLETAIDGTAYRNEILLELPKTSELNRSQIALQTLAEKNAILRTAFFELPNQKSAYSQVVWKSLPHSQVEIVREFSQSDGNQQRFSLLHPIQIQIRLHQGRVQMLLRIHHALYDAWSLELLLDDLNVILSGAHLQSRPSFVSVVEAHCEEMNSDHAWLSKDYWKDHLAQLDPLSIPNFHSVTNANPGLAVTTFRSSIVTRDLEATARSVSVSPQTFFQAACSLILSAYLGCDDICFGTVFSGRTTQIPGIEDIVGPCLATLPIRIDLATVSNVSDLIQQIHLTNRKHLEHCFLPLREIKKSCGIDPGRRLFDSLLVWQQTLHDNDHKRDFVTLEDSIDYLEFNLTLEITPCPGNIMIKANYQNSLLPSRQVDLLLQQVEELVLRLVASPNISLDVARSCFSPDMLSVENTNCKVDLEVKSLSASVEAMAINHPDAAAIEFAYAVASDNLVLERLTYGELNSQANQIAHHLVMHAVRPDDLVCICMEKSIELYVAILATSKTGAGYLPVTPDTPPERLHQILHDANVKVILSHSSLREHLRNVKSHSIVFVDKLNLNSLSSENLRVHSSLDNLAYCVFTSGSTGTPKGVLITQGNLLSNLKILAELYPRFPKSKFLQACSQAFDVSVFEIYFAWYVGGCLCTAVKDVLFRDIELVIQAFEITHLSLTPTVAALIDPSKVPKVKFLVTAGEAVTEKVFTAWADRGLFQGYGPSETTNICTVRPNMTKYHSINNIGPPLRNTSAFVLFPGDKFLLVPRGGEGEFCFGGEQVGIGYLNFSQTIGKFIEHPKYGRLYRSGDYGRLLPDGSLLFTRRKDDQVKVRGQRVELGEINVAMLRSPYVVNCTTTVVEGESRSNQRLVNFWVPNKTDAPEFLVLAPNPSVIGKLFASLVAALPAYMVPSALIPVSCLPSTTQGKIDRRFLVNCYRSLKMAYLDQTSYRSEPSHSHTWTEQEAGIVNIVADFVKIPSCDIGPDTSFFSLGIDSVSAISLSRTLRENTEFPIEISDILRYPTVSRLVSRMSQIGQLFDTSASQLSAKFEFHADFLSATTKDFEIEGKFVEQILPCTPLQEAMLSSSEISEGSYNQNLSFTLRGIISIEDFKNVWAMMITRHEILRTCFVQTTHSRFAFAQVVLKEFRKEWRISNQNEGDPFTSDLDGYKYKRNGTGYEPPYSLSFQESHSNNVQLSMHHALYDGFAINILFEEIEKALRNDPLPRSVSFAPFLHYLCSIDLDKADAHWDRLLNGYSSFQFPRVSSPPRRANAEHNGRGWERICPEMKLSRIEEQIKNLGCTLLSVCQAVWASLLSGHVNATDICFGNVISGRNVLVEGIDRLVAPCFNTIPVRLKDMHNLSFMESFRTLQTQNFASLPYQLTPLRRIQSRSSTGGQRLFDTLLILQQPVRDLDQSLWALTHDGGTMDLPLVLEITPWPVHTHDSLEVKLHHQPAYLSSQDANKLLQRFDLVLKRALENPRHLIMSESSRNLVSNRDIQPQMTEHRVGEDLVGENAAMTARELEIRDILAKFTDFPKDKIKRNTSIYRLGLDSISAVQFAARLRKRGHSVMGSDIIQNPSIAQLVGHLKTAPEISKLKPKSFDCKAFDKKHRESICSRYRIQSEHIAMFRPCTPVQCGMLSQSLRSSGQEYINSFCMELAPGTSLTKMRNAWESARIKHEMLRTSFVTTEDTKTPFVMATSHASHTSLPWNDYRGHAPHSLSSNNAITAISDASTTTPWTLEVFEDGLTTILKFTGHHALYDAHSLELILSDVVGSYDSEIPLSKASQSSITPLLESILTASEDNTSAKKSFWEKENKISINRFPDLSTLRQSSTRTLSREYTSKTSVTELEKYCRYRDVPIQVAGQAAWGRLLSAYVAESFVSFGITLSGRSVAEGSEGVAFPTIVTLPVSCHLAGTNSDLLNRTIRSHAQLLQHQFTPLASIQRWAGHPEGKIFDTLFAYQKTNITKSPTDLPWEIVQEEASADYSVSMEMQPITSGVLKLRITFKEHLVPVEQADLMLKQFDALLLDTLKSPNEPCDSLRSISPSILSIAPSAEPELPSPVKLLHKFVERQAQLKAKKIALEFTASFARDHLARSSWNYEQLNQEGNKIANLLPRYGVNRGDLVAICFEKCPEASFAILGILKAGCAYVALDPNAPPDRIKFIIQDSRSNLVLAAGNPARALPKIFGQPGADQVTKVVDLGDKRLMDGVSINPPLLQPPISPQDTSYCLYTSGTTGTPKGCEITHENAVQAMMSFQKLFEGHWAEDSKWLQFASFHFDVSVLEQFWSWSVGICVASAPRDLIFEDIPGAIRRMGVTHIDLTPSLARLLHPDDVPALTKGVFITGGEQLRQDILDVWGDYECIYNGYGPTEATIGVTMYPRVPKNGKPSNIGPQFQNVGSYVFKVGTTQPVLKGAVGELCVSGKLLGKGYLNRPDLTRERFPYIEEFGERVYRTGDLVRLLHDGSFLFLGRADDQVKLRGQRLELNEINEVIKKHVQNVQDVATLVLKHKEQQKEQLVTFFVPSSADTIPVSSLESVNLMQDACRAHLPAYMVPTYFIELDMLPLSGNNKADFKKLAGMFNSMSLTDLQKLSSAEKQAMNWTNKEQEVVRKLANILKVESNVITNSMNIFELGIDSISIIGLTRRLQSAGYANAKLSIVMKNSSIGSLVRILAAKESESETSNAVLIATQRIAAFAHINKLPVAEELKIDPSCIEHLAPCTPVQEGMIYRFLGSEEALYFTTFNFTLDGSMRMGSLRDAWMRVARQLQILRTKFVLTNSGVAQVVLRDYYPIWEEKVIQDELEELKGHGQRQNDEISKMGKSTALANPYRISILRYPKQTIMSINIFHGLYDGLSLPMMLRKVYNEYINRHDLVLRDLDYEHDFHSVLPYGPLTPTDGAETFWSEALRDIVDKSMPRLADPKASKDISMSRTISDVNHLEDLRQRLGVTYQALVQAAWCSVLQDYISPNITIGVVLSGRSIDFPNVENIIGPLLNTLPFHIRITAEMTWKDLVHACHDFNMRILPYQHTALKDIQKWCSHGTNQPLFDTLFVLQQEGDDDSDMENLWKVLPSEPIADYPLAFEAQLNNNGDIAMTIVGQKDILDEVMASSLLERVEVALRDLQSVDQKVPRSVISSQEEAHADIDNETHEQKTQEISNLDKEAFSWTADAQILKAEIEHLSGMSDVNEEMSIFELGLDSIDVIKLVTRLRNRGIRISVSATINSQTIVKMLDHISMESQSSTSKTIIIPEYEQKLVNHLRKAQKFPEEAITALPATPLQEGMVAEMISSKYTRYLNHELFSVPNHVNMEKLKDAWNTVIKRNDILRTQFAQIDDVDLPTSFAQVIYKPSESYWTSLRLPANAYLDSEVEKIIQKAREAAQNGPLLYLKDIRHGEDQHFILSIAHALYDGWSLQGLHEDVRKVYNCTHSNRPDPRSILDIVLNTDGPKAAKFWKTSLSGLQKSSFPERQDTSKNGPGVVHRRERASSHPLRRIQEFCKTLRVSLQTLGQTIWAMLLATHLNRLDVVFGTVLSCRDSEEASQLMFPLMNTVAVRSVIHGKINDMLQYMQETGNAIREYQHFPLRKAQALAGVNDGSLFDSLFIYQGQARNMISDEDRLYESVNSVSDVEFAVCVEMEVVQDALVWRIACKESVLSARETDKLLASLDDVLGSITQDPYRPTISSSPEGISICGLPGFNDRPSKTSNENDMTKTVAKSSPASWTAREMIIRRVLSQVSKIPEEQIDKEQTVFHLGLDSISAIKVSSLLRREGVRLSVGELLKNVVGNMEDAATSAQAEPNETQQDIEQILTDAMKNIDREGIIRKAKLDLANVEDILPVSAGQLYMLSRWQSSGGALFVGEFKYRLDSSIDRQRLERAWHTLQRKHRILRTVFAIADDRGPDGNEINSAVQIVLKETDNKIKWIDQPGQEFAVSFSSPLSLSIQISKGDIILYLRIHHGLYDGVSLPLILKDLQAFYMDPQGDVRPDTRFREFVALSRGDDMSVARQRQFWTSYLDLDILTLLHSSSEKEMSPSSSRVEIFEPDVPIIDVVSLAQKRGVSVDAILLAAFSEVYRQLLVEKDKLEVAPRTPPVEDVVFGLYLSNRAVFGEDLSSLAAPTLNLLPIRVASANSLVDIASKVQGDLQQLGSADIAGSSLANISEWTQVHVNCFVNILKSSEDDVSLEGSSTLFFKSSGEELRRRRVDAIESPPLQAEAELDSGLRNDAYLPSVDIEMRVTSGGVGLDIGVFAPAEYLDVEGARRVVERMKEVLRSMG